MIDHIQPVLEEPDVALSRALGIYAFHNKLRIVAKGGFKRYFLAGIMNPASYTHPPSR